MRNPPTSLLLLAVIGCTFVGSSCFVDPLCRGLAAAQESDAAVQKHSAEAIQESLNQSVEIQQPDAQKLEHLKILAGGRTDRGDYLYVCEGDFVWSLDRSEYMKRYETFAKSVPFGELGAAIGARYTPRFKKGDLVAKVRIRVRLEEAGGDLVAMSAKTVRFDLGLSKPVDSEQSCGTSSDK